MKRFVLFTISILFVLSSVTYSGEYKSGKNVIIADSIRWDLYSSGETLTISSKINGDVWAGCGSAFITNSIIQNLYLVSGDIGVTESKFNNVVLFGGKVNFNGTTQGSLKILGGEVRIEGSVKKDVVLIGGNIIIEKGATIDGDLIVFGGDVFIYGDVKGNLYGNCNTLEFYGKVNNSANLKISERLFLANESEIKGNLNLSSKRKLEFNSNVVKGTITFEKIHKVDIPFDKIIAILIVFCFLSALIVSMFVVLLLKNNLQNYLTIVDKSFLVTLAIGLVGIVGVPILCIILLALILTIPLSIIIGLITILFLYVGKILFAIYIGWKLLFMINKSQPNLYFSAFLGITILYCTYFIPVFGLFVHFFAALWGFGIACKISQQFFK